jgi:hypothetical protein
MRKAKNGKYRKDPRLTLGVLRFAAAGRAYQPFFPKRTGIVCRRRERFSRKERF